MNRIAMKEQIKEYWKNNKKGVILRIILNGIVVPVIAIEILSISNHFFATFFISLDFFAFVLIGVMCFVAGYASSRKMPHLFWLWGFSAFLLSVISAFVGVYIGGVFGGHGGTGSMAVLAIVFWASLFLCLPLFLGGLVSFIKNKNASRVSS